MVRPERFELPTCCSGGNRSIQLSYGRSAFSLHAERGRLNVDGLTAWLSCTSDVRRSA